MSDERGIFAIFKSSPPRQKMIKIKMFRVIIIRQNFLGLKGDEELASEQNAPAKQETDTYPFHNCYFTYVP